MDSAVNTDHAAVNLMVACPLLILSINDFNLFSPGFQKKNMSSMHRHHTVYIQVISLLLVLP